MSGEGELRFWAISSVWREPASRDASEDGVAVVKAGEEVDARFSRRFDFWQRCGGESGRLWWRSPPFIYSNRSQFRCLSCGAEIRKCYGGSPPGQRYDPHVREKIGASASAAEHRDATCRERSTPSSRSTHLALSLYLFLLTHESIEVSHHIASSSSLCVVKHTHTHTLTRLYYRMTKHLLKRVGGSNTHPRRPRRNSRFLIVLFLITFALASVFAQRVKRRAILQCLPKVDSAAVAGRPSKSFGGVWWESGGGGCDVRISHSHGRFNERIPENLGGFLYDIL